MKHAKYLKHIRGLDCCVSSTPAFGLAYPIVAHHLNRGSGRGIAQKASDYRCVPLRSDLHSRLHSIGEDEFWSEAGIDPFMVSLDLLIGWLEKS